MKKIMYRLILLFSVLLILGSLADSITGYGILEKNVGIISLRNVVVIFALILLLLVFFSRDYVRIKGANKSHTKGLLARMQEGVNQKLVTWGLVGALLAGGVGTAINETKAYNNYKKREAIAQQVHSPRLDILKSAYGHLEEAKQKLDKITETETTGFYSDHSVDDSAPTYNPINKYTGARPIKAKENIKIAQNELEKMGGERNIIDSLKDIYNSLPNEDKTPVDMVLDYHAKQRNKLEQLQNALKYEIEMEKYGGEKKVEQIYKEDKSIGGLSRRSEMNNYKRDYKRVMK
jgi:hypothetical protein